MPITLIRIDLKAVLSIIISVFLFSAAANSTVLTVNAGANDTICPGTSVTLGGTPTATGGTAPYTYLWTPSNNISSTTVSNPIANPTAPTWYYLTVTDSTGATKKDSVFVDLDPIWAYNAGQDTSICIGSTVQIGGAANSFAGGVTYLWTPSTALDNPNAPRPICSSTVTITYSVTITSPNCPSKSYSVTVTVNPLPIITACCATTINEGATTTLTVTGGVFYQWSPSNSLSNQYASTTTAEPDTTTHYLVFGMDQNGCYAYDTLTIVVIPSSELYFYNTFSPNGDGMNDFFFIGNVFKYPTCRLEVFTRTGQLVYAKTGYDNSWDGTNYGDKLPEATYYYVFDPGDGSAKKYGDVTIVR